MPYCSRGPGHLWADLLPIFKMKGNGRVGNDGRYRESEEHECCGPQRDVANASARQCRTQCVAHHQRQHVNGWDQEVRGDLDVTHNTEQDGEEERTKGKDGEPHILTC